VFFNGKLQFVSLLDRNIDSNHKDEVKWLVNVEVLLRDFKNIPFFDETHRYHGPALMIVGGRSKIYDFDKYQKVFPKITQKDIQIVADAGHWVHYDKPLETISLISEFIDKVDSNL
jgi:esterase